MEAVFYKIELKNDSHRITVGHSQMRHLIQSRTPDQHLRRLPGNLPCAEAVAEDRLDAKHLRLGQTPAMIADFFFPLFAPDLPDAPQVLIANQPLLLTIAVLPDLRIPLRRNRRLRLALADGFIAIALVIRAIAADLLKRILDLLQHLFEYLRVGDIVGRHHGGDDLARAFIGTEVQFSPGAALGVAMLADFPFAFTEDLHAGRIDDHMQRLVLAAARQGDLQGRTAAAQLAVIHDWQIQVEQLDDGTHQALGGAQRQMIDLFERRHAADRRIAVSARLAGFASFFGVAPDGQHVITDPEGQASALHEGCVILFPVAEAIGALGFLALHKSRIPALSSPCFMQQSRSKLSNRGGFQDSIRQGIRFTVCLYSCLSSHSRSRSRFHSSLYSYLRYYFELSCYCHFLFALLAH
jgi:hypothetical protein